MDYSTLTDEQRSACIQMLGWLHGRAIQINETGEFDGTTAIAVSYAFKKFEALVIEELEALVGD
ncbi:hypothetical protein [Sediminivirga luteola]|uniref:Uncharacterized protein n=1 Tax=Sediminivirga luteola TaxID=1774748 RepID=A0A8J2TXF2_9MICO|nr:hypothetical protein [Sediminivirga luteola]GGA11063.1 hypothetical protein GCM10011333_12390 [Sediminivirga luteola]